MRRCLMRWRVRRIRLCPWPTIVQLFLSPLDWQTAILIMTIPRMHTYVWQWCLDNCCWPYSQKGLSSIYTWFSPLALTPFWQERCSTTHDHRQCKKNRLPFLLEKLYNTIVSSVIKDKHTHTQWCHLRFMHMPQILSNFRFVVDCSIAKSPI